MGMDFSFIVKGYLTDSDKEKRILYVGINPKIAFGYFDNYNVSADISIEIWESGSLVRVINGVS